MTRVMQVITTRDLGGAQLTALASVRWARDERCDVLLYAGRDDQSGGAFDRVAAESGVTVRTVPGLVRRLAPLHDLLAWWSLFREMRRIKPDVVHSHSSKAGVLARTAARVARVPTVIHTVHGWSFNDNQPAIVRWLCVWLERVLARATTALVVVTAEDRALGLRRRIGRPAKYAIIRSGIDLSVVPCGDQARRRARARLGLDDREFVVGAVMRLAAQKRPLTLLDAFRGFASSQDGVRLVVVGDGPMRADVERRVLESSLSDRVMLLGATTDVVDLYAAFDVFVSCSVYEGLPRTLVEAIAAGVPVVATPVNGVVELIDHGKTGWSFPVDDSSALQACLEIVRADPVGTRHMATVARGQLEEFDVRQMAISLRDVWHGNVERKSRASSRSHPTTSASSGGRG